MDLIGLTGGIATGKSTVAGMLRERGAIIVDSDQGARAVVEPGTPGFDQVVAEFGPQVVRDGRLDRSRLGEIVFADSERRRRLEVIVHPLVRAWAAERVGEAAAAGASRVVLEIPLLYESARETGFAAVIVVYAPDELAIRRLIERNGLTEAQARARLAAQLPIEEKRRHATYVVDNSGDVASTRDQVDRLWTEITESTGSAP